MGPSYRALWYFMSSPIALVPRQRRPASGAVSDHYLAGHFTRHSETVANGSKGARQGCGSSTRAHCDPIPYGMLGRDGPLGWRVSDLCDVNVVGFHDVISVLGGRMLFRPKGTNVLSMAGNQYPQWKRQHASSPLF